MHEGFVSAVAQFKSTIHTHCRKHAFTKKHNNPFKLVFIVPPFLQTPENQVLDKTKDNKEQAQNRHHGGAAKFRFVITNLALLHFTVVRCTDLPLTKYKVLSLSEKYTRVSTCATMFGMPEI